MAQTAWQSRPFRNFVMLELLASFAEEALAVAIGWFVYQQTRSAFALGLIGLAGFLPAILLSLVTGLVADRYDRRLILLVCNLALAAGALVLSVITIRPSVPLIYAVVLAMGVAKGFLGPASKAILPSLLEEGDFTRALAITSSIGEGAKLVAPAIGGVLYVIGTAVPFAVASAAFAAAAFLAIGIGARRPEVTEDRPDLAVLAGGYRFILKRPVVLGAMSLDLVAVLLGGVTALLPIYVDQVFHAGAWALGVLRAAPAAGALIAAGVLAVLPMRRFIGPKLLWSVAVYGLATIGFGLSTKLGVAFGFLGLLGASDTVSQVIRQTLVQTNTPDDMRGRVSAVHEVVTGASNELGEFESGMLAALVGAIPAILLGGAAALAAALAWNWLFPAIRKADRIEAEPIPTAS
jgi:MFS family permease